MVWGAVAGDLQPILMRAFAMLNQHPLQVQIGRFQRRLNLVGCMSQPNFAALVRPTQKFPLDLEGKLSYLRGF